MLHHFTSKPLPFLALIFLFSISYSCGNAKKTAQTSNKKTTKGGLITNKTIVADETFSSITNNTARLREMLSGQYVQHNLIRYDENDQEVYETWTVNGGKDSMMLLSIPVSEPGKVGYWLYHYQTMTSLPNEPIYTAFEKFVEVDRDTIRSVFYEAPEDFKVPFEELIEKTNAAFETVKLDELELSKDGERVLYVRQNPLFFKGFTPLMPNFQEKGTFKQDDYIIKPSGIIYTSLTYEQEDAPESIGGSRSKFVKLGMFRSYK